MTKKIKKSKQVNQKVVPLRRFDGSKITKTIVNRLKAELKKNINSESVE